MWYRQQLSLKDIRRNRVVQNKRIFSERVDAAWTVNRGSEGPRNTSPCVLHIRGTSRADERVVEHADDRFENGVIVVEWRYLREKTGGYITVNQMINYLLPPFLGSSLSFLAPEILHTGRARVGRVSEKKLPRCA